jgi:hypothetical protein
MPNPVLSAAASQTSRQVGYGVVLLRAALRRSREGRRSFAHCSRAGFGRLTQVSRISRSKSTASVALSER